MSSLTRALFKLQDAVVSAFNSPRFARITQPLVQMWYLGEVPLDAHLVGRDQYGNSYYERRGKDVIHCRDRFVMYAKHDFDASQVPADWHTWLHKTSDVPPSQTAYPQSITMTKHSPNWTGTDGHYVPYSTTIRKIQPWLGVPESRAAQAGARGPPLASGAASAASSGQQH